MLRPRAMQFIFDVLAVTFTVFVYLTVRELIIPGASRYLIEQKIVLSVALVLYWTTLFWLGGLYRDYYVRSPFEEFFAVLKQSFFGTATLFFLIVFDSAVKNQPRPRFFIVVFLVVLFLALCIGRILARRLQREFRERGIVQVEAVLLGTPNRLVELITSLRKEPAWGYVVKGSVTVGTDDTTELAQYTSILGTSDRLVDILSTHNPREVLISVEGSDHTALLQWTAACADSNIAVKIVPDLYEIFSGQVRTQQIYGSPLIEVSPELMQPWEEFAKRLLDITVSLVVLLIGLPLWLLIALLVKVSSKGPVFFVQERVGRLGQRFEMVKFRSMFSDDERTPSWTLTNDPRVTPVGRFIRKTHLDEVPQFWNVLRGEMSLVGPRPEQSFFVEKFSTLVPYYRRRLKVRPGITGWWQVKARSGTESMEEIETRLRYDFFYIENISFRLDLEILFRTVIVMIKGHGKA
ncbi:MAG: sugar transferase [bacterium]|nr:sugar transferase [bacterium]